MKVKGKAKAPHPVLQSLASSCSICLPLATGHIFKFKFNSKFTLSLTSRIFQALNSHPCLP